jgi:hypothetical protein
MNIAFQTEGIEATFLTTPKIVNHAPFCIFHAVDFSVVLKFMFHIFGLFELSPGLFSVVYDLMEISEPSKVFLPLGAALRSLEVRYADLSDHEFTCNEKSFICREIRGFSSVLAPTNIGQDVRTKDKTTVRGISDRYNIPRRTLRGWLLIETDDSKVFHAHGGRPWDIDGQGNEEIAAEIRALNARTRGPFFSEFPKLLQQKKRDILPTVSANQRHDFISQYKEKKSPRFDRSAAARTDRC